MLKVNCNTPQFDFLCYWLKKITINCFISKHSVVESSEKSTIILQKKINTYLKSPKNQLWNHQSSVKILVSFIFEVYSFKNKVFQFFSLVCLYSYNILGRLKSEKMFKTTQIVLSPQKTSISDLRLKTWVRTTRLIMLEWLKYTSPDYSQIPCQNRNFPSKWRER